jgi:hypothetical protein
MMNEAMTAFKGDVESKAFPAEEHSAFMKDEEWEALLEELGETRPAEA